MLCLVDLAKAALSDDTDLLKKSLVPILLKVLAELVVICLLLIPEYDGIMNILPRGLMFFNSDKVNNRFIIQSNILSYFTLFLKFINFDLVICLRPNNLWLVRGVVGFGWRARVIIYLLHESGSHRHLLRNVAKILIVDVLILIVHHHRRRRKNWPSWLENLELPIGVKERELPFCL